VGGRSVDAGVSRSWTLVEVTRGKGGYGTLTIFALMRPALCPEERELIMEIGEALQMLDDYADVDEDRRNGIRTTATEGHLHLADIARRLRAARPLLATYYGRRPTRAFLAVCYLTMWICYLNRRWPRLRPRSDPARSTLTVVTPRAVDWPVEGTDPDTIPARRLVG
jgi:hypothetical protein